MTSEADRVIDPVEIDALVDRSYQAVVLKLGTERVEQLVSSEAGLEELRGQVVQAAQQASDEAGWATAERIRSSSLVLDVFDHWAQRWARPMTGGVADGQQEELAMVQTPPETQKDTGQTAPTAPRPGVRRVNVNFSDQAYKTLEGLAEQTGKTMSEVLRDAIALKAWFEQVRTEKGHVLVEKDGKIREVITV